MCCKNSRELTTNLNEKVLCNILEDFSLTVQNFYLKLSFEVWKKIFNSEPEKEDLLNDSDKILVV